MAMRVGLNAICFDDRPSGAKQRFLGIYGALISAHPEIDFVIYEPADCRVAQWFAGAANVVARPTPVPSSGQLRKAVAGARFWRHRLRADRLDLFETFNLPMVVAPDCPTGPREVLADGRFGYLVPVGDPAALAAGIERALDHPIAPDLLAEAVRPFEESVVVKRHFELLMIDRAEEEAA